MVGKNEIKEALGDIIAGKILYDEPMSRHTSLNVGGNADALVFIKIKINLLRLSGNLEKRK
jgi:hypothetical protein